MGFEPASVRVTPPCGTFVRTLNWLSYRHRGKACQLHIITKQVKLPKALIIPFLLVGLHLNAAEWFALEPPDAVLRTKKYLSAKRLRSFRSLYAQTQIIWPIYFVLYCSIVLINNTYIKSRFNGTKAQQTTLSVIHLGPYSHRFREATDFPLPLLKGLN